jgi:hypothetical protein
VGFCVIVDDSAANQTKGVESARPRLIGHGKRFGPL